MPRTPKLPRANARYWVEEAKLELRVANDYRNEPAMGLIRCARAHAATELAIKAVSAKGKQDRCRRYRRKRQCYGHVGGGASPLTTTHYCPTKFPIKAAWNLSV